ncbi:protein S100-A13 [Latimeria chalumnae]|uniref:protein S100-A13 n=1 Tax=Latimeria chalumnae TaxID=7897 RepID=UPI0003C16EBE|nr:PREDICTED: protein S100-A13 [Latimeria chalumnae]|eukprot:XP_006008439.1 PREDICTED: protein S100-A13 [Latimeria chalumnae]
MATDMSKAVGTIVAKFKQHAKEEGKKDTLSLGEFKNLLLNDLPEASKKVCVDCSIEEVMSGLDANKDDVIDFEEFWILLMKAAMLKF